MANADEIYKQWVKVCPKEADVADVRKVAKYFLGDFVKEPQGGSHFLVIEHPAFSIHPAFGGKSTLSISHKSGRKVHGIYVKHLLLAIECVNLYNANKKKE